MSLVNANSYNENDGTTIRDYSESLNHSTTVNSVTLTADDIGYYADFDGSSSNYTIPGLTIYGTDEKITIYCEFRADVITGTYYLVQRDDGFSVLIESSSIIFRVTDGITTHSVSLAIEDTTWHKVVCTFSAVNGLAIYLDGSGTSDTDVNTVTPNDVNNIFVGYDGTTNYYDGRIRDLRFYDSEFSTTEVDRVMEISQGIRSFIHNQQFNVGDLVVQDNRFSEGYRGVVYATKDDEVRTLPMNTEELVRGDALTRCGHRWDSDRQAYLRFDGDNNRAVALNEVQLHSEIDDLSKQILSLSPEAITYRVRHETTDYNVNKYDYFNVCTPASNPMTVTLDANPLTGQFHVFKVKNTSELVIDGNGNNVDGNATESITANEGYRKIIYDGTEWEVVSSN